MDRTTKPELHYTVHPGTGPYLLLVHGFLSSQSHWQPNLTALARVTQPVVVGLWGHGDSPAPEDPALYHPDAYVELFERLRIHLGVERWLLCGQSLGAALTLRYALDHPDRIIAQLFTNSNAALADPEWLTTRRVSARRQAEEIDRDGLRAIESIPVHPVHAKRLPPDTHAALLAEAQHHTPRGIANTLRYTTPEAPIRHRLHTNRVPTLLICGEREKRFAPRRDFAERAIPGLQVIGTPAGHAVNIEAADAFNAAAVDFIRQYI